MNESSIVLERPPIVEAVLDIDCDMPTTVDVEALDVAARAALAGEYPVSRRRVLSEHQISGAPDQPLAVTSRQGLVSLQYCASDEKQLVQFRPGGYSFNRLAPYATLENHLPEIERTWRLFVDIAKPVVCRAVRLRYINRIELPMVDGKVEVDGYLNLAPRLPDEKRLTFAGFFNQHSMLEAATGNQANIVVATQPPTKDRLPILFDIETFRVMDCEPADWQAVSGRIASLRSLKNLIFRNSLTEKCLNLFRS
jgi:uncharacterized protein (TIGR04255 family)